MCSRVLSGSDPVGGTLGLAKWGPTCTSQSTLAVPLHPSSRSIVPAAHTHLCLEELPMATSAQPVP